ncbi:MAG: alpha-amylase [Rikenellaceae bacterium]|nr:alpha-amylase [Rikenellaceae bacterium]MDE7355643.1 alpha-amylase [Rikenellaceae bacterium]
MFENKTIYEVNIRQYTPEGTFAAFEPHIERLRDMGVGVLWFMPIYPIGVPHRKGSLGSYYSISDYKGVNPEFGTKDDFLRLVDKAHDMGMYVLLDMVCNHTAWDNVWLREGHTDWYATDEHGNVISPFDWTDTAKLNYSNHYMRMAMIEAMEYWVTEFGVDGFREDMAGLVPLDFWQQAIGHLRRLKPDIFMLGEVEDPAFDAAGLFDATYAWEFGHLMERVAGGRYGADELRGRLDYERSTFPAWAGRLRFTSNHDENSWSGSEYERMGEAAHAMAALTFVTPSIPLIYSGQEAGNRRRIEFFDKDLIDWSDLAKMNDFYRQLCRLKSSLSVLRSGEEGAPVEYMASSQPENVLAFKRKDGHSTLIAVFNMTPYHIQPAFYDDDYTGTYNKLWHGTMELCSGRYDPFAPWEFKIYYKEG